MRISMARGDIHYERFIITNPDRTKIDVDLDNVYFTVKKNFKTSVYIFQKSYLNDTIQKLGLGDYQVKIEPDDTKDMAYGNYVFDIQIQYGNTIKQTFPGDFVVTNEATYPENE